MSEIVLKIMENHKLDSEEILIHLERLETKLAELNEDINRFIGKRDETLPNFEDFNTFLNIASEENDVVNNCQSLARFLTDDSNTNHGNVDNSTETGNNGNDKVNSDELFVKNAQGFETLMGMSMRESEEPSSSMKESYSSYYPNVEDTGNYYLILHDNSDSPEQLDTNYDCSALNKDISYTPVNLNPEHKTLQEQNHDVISKSNYLIIDNVTEPNVDVLGRDLIDNRIPHHVEAVSIYTDIFTIDQNQTPNIFSNEEKRNNSAYKSTAVQEEENNGDCISLMLFSNKEKENNCSDKSTSVEEEVHNKDSNSLKLLSNEEKKNNSPHKFISVEEDEDNEDSISLILLTNEEKENSSPHKSTSVEEEEDKEVSTSQNVFSKEEKGNNSPYKSTAIEAEEDSEDCISLLDNEEHFFSDVLNYEEATNNSHEENSNYVYKGDNGYCLPYSNKNKQRIFIDSNLNKYPHEQQITNLHCNSIEFMSNGCDQNVSCDNVNSIETHKQQKLPDFPNSDFYKDIYTWDDESQFYIEENSGNGPEEFGLLSDNLYQQNSYQKDSGIDNFTHERKRKNMILFRNVCYFYVINKCNRSCCTFPHVIPDVSDVKLELKKFNNNLLIEEYDLIKDNKIKIGYGLCFLEECSERNLSREVVRMAIDFIKITNNSEENESDFHSNIVKTTLQHINKTNNLDECRDLLTAPNFSKIRCFGDILMETISVTEHFSNYKVAFVKLIDIIMPKAFSNKVTKDILKQICSIGNEAPLSRALLNIIRYTNPKILWDPVIEQFENMIRYDNELISDYLKLKKDMLQTLMSTNDVNTKNATSTFYNNVQESTDNVSSSSIKGRLDNNTTNLMSKTALPSNLLPATKQCSSNGKCVSSSNIDQRLSINNRIIYMPKEAVPNKTLSMIRQDATNNIRVLSSIIVRSPSNDTKTISVPKEALPSNPLPVTGQDPSYSEHVSSSNINRRPRQTKTISVPKEALSSNPLPVTRQDSYENEHVSSSNMNRRPSNDSKTISVPKYALSSKPPPVPGQVPSASQDVSSSNIYRKHKKDTKSISVPKEALPSNLLIVTRLDPNYNEHVSSSNINRRPSNDTETISVAKETLSSNPLPVTGQDPSYSEHVSSSSNNRRLSHDTKTIFIPRETLLNRPLTVTRQGSCNSDHVLSSKVTRSYSSGTNIVKPKLPGTRQQDPNYISKEIIKRRKSTTKIHPWSTKEKSLDGTKENHTK